MAPSHATVLKEAEVKTPEEAEPEWMTLSEVGLMTGLAQGTLYKKIKEKLLPGYSRMGKTVLKREDVIAFMQPKPKLVRSKKRGKR